MTDFCGNSVGTHFCSCKNDACAAPVRSVWLSVWSERARNGARSIELHSLRFVLLLYSHPCCYCYCRPLNESNAERIAHYFLGELRICYSWEMLLLKPHCISWAWNCLAVGLKMCPGQWARPKLPNDSFSRRKRNFWARQPVGSFCATGAECSLCASERERSFNGDAFYVH